MVNVPTREEFQARINDVNAALANLRARMAVIESPTSSDTPVASGLAASNITATGATVSGVVEPKGQPFTWQFEWGPTDAYGNLAPAIPTLASAETQTVSAQIAGATPGGTTHFRLKVANGAGTAYSGDATFVASDTPSTPTVEQTSTFNNTNIGTGNNQAEYTGSWSTCTNCSPAETPTDYRYSFTSGAYITLRFNGVRLVYWGPNQPAGSPAAQVLVDGVAAGTANFKSASGSADGNRFDTGVLGDVNADHTVRITVPSTGDKWIAFHHALVYTVTGGEPTVTAPAVTVNAASAVTATTAALSGTVTPNGATTTWAFQYGTTTGYGSQSPASPGSIPAGAGVNASTSLSGLTASTLYHWRLQAVNSAGTANSDDQTFSTTATGAAMGRITRTGTQLMLGGRQYRFAGMNWEHAVACGPTGSTPTAEQADRYFRELNPRSMTRIFVFPGASLAQYDLIVQAAQANGQYLCVCLFNHHADCGTYTASYGTPINATMLGHLDAVVTRHAGNPAVAMYEPANEASDSNIANWYQAMATAIKARDSQALVGTGGGVTAQTAADLTWFAGGADLDLISCHATYSPSGAVTSRAAAFNQAATTVSRAWYMGARGFANGGGDQGLTVNGARLTAEYGLYLAGTGDVSHCAGYAYRSFALVQSNPATEATFDNALWAAARTYNNSAWNGS